MGSMGGIGSVNAEFTASTGNFSAAVKEVSASLSATAAKAQEAGTKIEGVFAHMHRQAGESVADYRARAMAAQQAASAEAEGARKVRAGLDAMTVAAERLRAAKERAQAQYAREADAQAEVAHSEEHAALRADILARANKTLADSTNPVIAAFGRMTATVTESSEAIQARLLETAEAANVEAEGISAGFAGLSTLLGAGIAVGFAAHFLDGLAKMNLELALAAERTGVSAQELAGLQLKTEEVGGSFDQVAMGISRLGRAQQQAKDALANHEPLNEYTRAFRELGISMKEVQHDTPEQMLDRVARAFAETHSSATRTSAAIELFSRAGVRLIPILTEEGSQLHANALVAAKMKGITDQSIESARRWQYGVADLSAEFRAHLMPALTYAPDVIIGVVGAFDAAAAIIVDFADVIGRAAVVAVKSVVPLAKILADIGTGNYSAIAGDFTGISTAFTQQVAGASKDLKASWDLVKHDFTSTSGDKFKVKPFDPNDIPVTDPDAGMRGKRGNKADREQRDAWQEQLEALKGDHTLTLAEEADFWTKRVAEARKGNKLMAETRLTGVRGREMKLLASEQPGGDAYKRVNAALKPDDAEGKKLIADLLRQQAVRDRAVQAAIRQNETMTIAAAKLDAATGKISKYDEAQIVATAHTIAYRREMESLTVQMQRLMMLPDTEAKQERIQDQMNALNAARPEQEIADQAEMAAHTISGALSDAMGEFVQQAEDTAAQVKEIFTSTIEGVNHSISSALMEHAYSGQERWRDLRNGLSNTFRSQGGKMLDNSMSRAESMALAPLGIHLGGKKPTLAAGDAGHVVVDNLGDLHLGGGMTIPGVNMDALRARSQSLQDTAAKAASIPSSFSIPAWAPAAMPQDTRGSFAMPNLATYGISNSVKPSGGASGAAGDNADLLAGFRALNLPDFQMPSVVGPDGTTAP
ncbi:MAG: hypothetical protein WA708_13205, partial [Acidobacteriaceae bacterium]